MSEQPYVPFYKPYGMSDEEYQSEVSAAQERLAEWESQQVDEAGDEQTRIFIDKIRSELTAELLAKIEEIDRNKSIWPNEHFYELRRWLTQSKEKAA